MIQQRSIILTAAILRKLRLISTSFTQANIKRLQADTRLTYLVQI